MYCKFGYPSHANAVSTTKHMLQDAFSVSNILNVSKNKLNWLRSWLDRIQLCKLHRKHHRCSCFQDQNSCLTCCLIKNYFDLTLYFSCWINFNWIIQCLVSVAPIKDLRNLNVVWPIPDLHPYYKSNVSGFQTKFYYVKGGLNLFKGFVEFLWWCEWFSRWKKSGLYKFVHFSRWKYKLIV